ncbi:unnamed protein product [Rotaria magnacalcarata]|uniref:Uncharacterized protein n=1 Tax=Rotaria magnacalcarata TaxID=392030 RepID=A0A816UW78_9BILA|nr:unnamed protein product [Rotaria magnacalcarata]CAF4329239.1 unnamed protein product [Rotaria magnacalcarata]
MDSNSTQPGNIPSEPTLNNNESEASVDQLAYTRLVNLRQTSTMHMHTGDMIPTQIETNTRNRIPIQMHTTSYWLTTDRRANTGNRIRGQIQTNTTEEQEAILNRRRDSRRQYRQRRAQRRREQRAIEQAQRQQRQQQHQRHQQPRQHQRGRSQQRRQERRQRWLQRLQQQEQNPSRLQTNYHPRVASPGDYDYYSGEEDQDNLLEAYDWETMTSQQRYDQQQIMQFEGFAALEQLLLMAEQREQSQRIRETEEIDEERQQQLQRTHDSDQRRLLDYEENQNGQMNEQNEDPIQQLDQINQLEHYDNERHRQTLSNNNSDQRRLHDYLRIPTPPSPEMILNTQNLQRHWPL